MLAAYPYQQRRFRVVEIDSDSIPSTCERVSTTRYMYSARRFQGDWFVALKLGSFPDRNCSSTCLAMASRSPGISSAGISAWNTSESFDAVAPARFERWELSFDGDVPSVGYASELAATGAGCAMAELRSGDVSIVIIVVANVAVDFSKMSVITLMKIWKKCDEEQGQI